MISNKPKLIVFSLLVFMFWVPFLCERLYVLQGKPLAGVYSLAEKPGFSFKEWFAGEYQVKYEKYIEHHIGMRNYFVRLRNQLDYSFFKLSNAEKVIVGKDGYLYEKNYIDAYLGNDFVGESVVSEKIRKIKELQLALKAKNIDLILAFAPGKGSFYPEFIPACFNVENKTAMNYDWVLKRSQDAGINYIDMAGILLSMKNSARYPLMPKCGIHWSYYGMSFCADTLIKYMENLHGTKFPHVCWSDVEVTNKPKDPDNDLGELMNLLWDIPVPEMAYPKLEFKKEEGSKKPNVLVIGDSYYWNLQKAGIIENVFANQDFWYYNYEIYKDKVKTDKTVPDIDVKAEVEKQDFVILLSTDAGLGNPGYGFVDKAYDIFAGKKDTSLINKFIRKIKADKVWVESIRKKAEEKKISVDDMIRMDAEWMAEEEAKQK